MTSGRVAGAGGWFDVDVEARDAHQVDVHLVMSETDFWYTFRIADSKAAICRALFLALMYTPKTQTNLRGTRRASTKGPRTNVGGRREGAYRHRVVCCCRSGMDFDETAKAF